MWTSFKLKFAKKISALGRAEQLYIIPTLDGLKLVLLNLILLIIGLVYANNYVLLFNFILFCLFFASMFYTHFNLQGLKLISAKIQPLHACDNGILTLQFKTTSGLGHFFIGIRIKNNLIEIQKHSFSFPPNNGSYKSLKVDIPIKATKRGLVTIDRICIETLFPFHLFCCFAYFKPPLVITIYPEKKRFRDSQSKK